MNGSRQDTALLFFSRTAMVEASAKRWLPQSLSQGNKGIAQLLIQQAQKVLATAPFQVFHFTEDQQHGRSFGERFSNAFQELFQLGYQSVIAVGNDTPCLQGLDWLEIQQELAQGHAVIGPNFRGGNYLIALNRKHFSQEKFETLPWQTGKLSAALQYYFEKEGATVSYLPAFRDLNTLADLWNLFQELPKGLTLFGELLRSLLKATISLPPKAPHFTQAPPSSIHGLRGPPALSPPF